MCRIRDYYIRRQDIVYEEVRNVLVVPLFDTIMEFINNLQDQILIQRQQQQQAVESESESESDESELGNEGSISNWTSYTWELCFKNKITKLRSYLSDKSP